MSSQPYLLSWRKQTYLTATSTNTWIIELGLQTWMMDMNGQRLTDNMMNYSLVVSMELVCGQNLQK